jgi:hypothetical protein
VQVPASPVGTVKAFSEPVELRTSQPLDENSLRATLANQHATIQALERRLAKSAAELAESENRVASLIKKNNELTGLAKTRGKEAVPVTRIPVSNLQSRVVNAGGRQMQAGGTPERERFSAPNSAERALTRDHLKALDEADYEVDEIDATIRKYLSEHPDVNVEFEKISTMRKGWYYVKPIGKKVFLKQAGKDKLVVRVGGGHVSFLKFLADFVQGAEGSRVRGSSVGSVRRSESR